MEIAFMLAGLLVFAGHLLEVLFRRTQIPDVLWLVLIGLFIGPTLGLLHPSDLGKVGFFLAKLALIVILFEGGADMHIEFLRGSLRSAFMLGMLGFAVFACVCGVVGGVLLDLSPLEAALFGSILGATSAIVVIPIIRGLKVSKNAETLLIVESVLADVVCIVVTLALLDAYVSGKDVHIGRLVGDILTSFVMASIIGALGGVVWSYLLTRVKQFPHTTVTTIAFLLFLYGFCEILGYSGAISSLAFGFTLGNVQNMPMRVFREYVRFKPVELDRIDKMFFGELSFLLKVFFFVYLGISMFFNSLFVLGVGALLTVLMLVARILLVKLILGRSSSAKDAAVISVMVPRGLVPAVLVLILIEKGVEKAIIFQEVVFSVILISILLTTVMVLLMEYMGSVYAVYVWFFRTLRFPFFSGRAGRS